MEECNMRKCSCQCCKAQTISVDKEDTQMNLAITIISLLVEFEGSVIQNSGHIVGGPISTEYAC